MFFAPGRTPYDIYFRLFGTYVRVHVLFWLVAAVLGQRYINDPLGLRVMLIWIGCVFVFILLHEFGHIWAGQLFGSHGEIVLYSMGGLAIGANEVSERWKKIIISLAGPFIQLAFYYLFVEYIKRAQPDWIFENEWGKRFANMALWINWYWPMFNLLPIYPLDGGQVTRQVCEGISNHNGFRAALMISMGTVALIALNTLLVMNGQLGIKYVPVLGHFGLLMMAMFAVMNYQMLQMENDRRPWEDQE